MSEGWGQTPIECSALSGTSVAYAPSFRELLRRGGRKHARAGRQRGHCETLFSEHGVDINPTAADLRKMEPVNILSLVIRGLHKALTVAEGLLAARGSLGSESHFLPWHKQY